MSQIYLYNYHSHSKWCNHADGELEEYILEAIKHKLKDFAICDHMPDDDSYGDRMSFKDFPSYIEECNRLKVKYKPYFSNLYITSEIEYHKEQIALYKHMLKKEFDFLILGQHQSSDNKVDYYHMKNIEKDTLKYTNDILEAMNTKLFKILAHPDFITVNYDKPSTLLLSCMDKIFSLAEKLNIYVELNANGLRNNKLYPCKDIWLLTKKYPNLKIIISSDAHSPTSLWDKYIEEAYKFADELNLKIEEKIII